MKIIKKRNVKFYMIVSLIIICFISCQNFNSPVNHYAYYTETVPVIDGKTDDYWSKIPKIVLKNYTLRSENVKDNNDLSTVFKMIWNNTNLYILIMVNDDKKFDVSKFKYDIDMPNAYQSDSVELFFDVHNNKNNGIDSFDSQNGDSRYEFVYNREGVTGEFKSSEGIIFAQSDTSKGYMFEIAIPFETLSLEQKTDFTFGFDITVRDNDGIVNRNGFSNFDIISAISWSQKEGTWASRNTGLFGNITLLKKQP